MAKRWAMLLCVPAVFGTVALVVWWRPDRAPVDPGPIKVVAVTEATNPTRGPPASVPAPLKTRAALIDDAPEPIQTLHASIDDDARDAAAEKEIAAQFVRDPRFTSFDARCSLEKCEVSGTVRGDETTARLAVRGDEMLDRYGAIGMSAGMDTVTQRGEYSDFVVFLDRAPRG